MEMSMKELRQTAVAYHGKESCDKKLVVREMFSGMHPNNEGGVSFQNFSTYMKMAGHESMSSEAFYNELKQMRKSELFFEDIITLSYIIETKRPFCGGHCKKFIKGIYFVCVKCFEDGGHGHIGSTFSVCSQCFTGDQFRHQHVKFEDPGAILNRYKGMKPSRR